MDQIKASSFSEASHITDAGLPGFHQYNNRIYFNYIRNFQLTDGQEFLLAIYYDITMLLFEMTVLGAAAILLFLISMLIIYIRGNYLTRKAFGVVDEMIVKAGNISSQNLNLRLNVNDSTDELIEFALTFNGMMDRIEKAYEKQKQFVSDASHELRTPIAVIQGYARMLDRWGKDDKAILQESIDAISKESKNMQDLVDKLLFIARNDKDTLVLVKNKFNMSELVQELIRETKMLETNHEIGGSVTPDVILDGDRDQIKQALRIFVDNAIKYTKPGGTITISLQVEDGSAVATVRDSGMGIPEKELPNIFDRFYRVDAARERDIGGHGLGLSIARIIILRHGGCIKVASKLGGGTRFRIYLPMVEPEVQS
jgi:signal transduction histidine kinase